MATGRPNLLSMAAGLLIYPVYVVQVSNHTRLSAVSFAPATVVHVGRCTKYISRLAGCMMHETQVLQADVVPAQQPA